MAKRQNFGTNFQFQSERKAKKNSEIVIVIY